MAALKDTEREWIVQRLACYETPADVAGAASEEFGKDVTRQQVEHYDPNRSDRVAEKWESLFEETRDEYLTNERQVAIANKMWRLRRLQDIVQDEDATREEKMEALEQAAKESGGKYTNEHQLEHSGPNRGPIQMEQDVKMSDAELAQIANEAEASDNDR
jgi:hypothetical protein